LSDMTSLMEMRSLMSLELVRNLCGDLNEANTGIDEVDVMFLREIERVYKKLLWEFEDIITGNDGDDMMALLRFI